MIRSQLLRHDLAIDGWLASHLAAKTSRFLSASSTVDDLYQVLEKLLLFTVTLIQIYASISHISS